MVKKGKKKKQAASASGDAPGETSQQTSQQQPEVEKQPSLDSSKQKKDKSPPQQVVPGSSQQQVSKGRQQIFQDQPQQQQGVAPSQLQGIWGHQRQQVSQGQQQQQQQVPQGQPQVMWGPQHQSPQGIPQHQQQQQQVPQDQPQRAWGPRPQVSQGIPQHQQQQQQVPQGQPQRAWGPRPQVSQGVPQHQQQQQQVQGQPQAWGQPQRAWGPQQQVPQQQQLVRQGQPQQHGTVEVVGTLQQQPSTSTPVVDISQVGLMDPFYSQKAEKVKMSSEQLKLYHEMIPNRVNPQKAGTLGQKITVWTNMFEIIFSDNFVTNAVHYDVDIKPFKEKENTKKDAKQLKLPKALCRRIFEECRKKHFMQRFPAYDGNKNAYSANELPFNDNMMDVFSHINEKEQRKQYQITIRKVAYIDLSWIKNLRPGFGGNRDQTAVQVLDIIMRHAPESRFLNVGRSLFWDINEGPQLGTGLFLSRGGFMSGTLGWKPYLNVDVSHKGFTIGQNVLKCIAEFARCREEDLTYQIVRSCMTKLMSYLKGLKVSYAIPKSPTSKRTHRIVELSNDTCDSYKFRVNDREYTITTYFWEVKRYKIYRPDLQALHVGNISNGGKVMVPLELCTIVSGQPFNKKLDDDQTRDMIRAAATPAYDRKRRIEDAFSKINVNDSPVMKNEFRLSINPQMKQVEARILPAPTLKYAEKTSLVTKGVWNMQPFSQPENLETNSWTILDLSAWKLDDDIQKFVKLLQDAARSCGMRIDQPERPFKSFNPRDSRILAALTRYFNDYKYLKLIIVIIPNQQDMYSVVKKITEMDVGVLTQCVKAKTVQNVAQRSTMSTVKNILLKINSKLNGVNHTLYTVPTSLSSCPCMLVGADVTHPPPDSKDSPSIAAVAASRNSFSFLYNTALRLQPPKEEIILDLEEIILTQLNTYNKEAGHSPQRIIYYRDGVSEGQLSQVMYYEINAIRSAIKRFNKGKIEVTCLVVQKRHHVRLFPTNPAESDDKNRNVKAGTIVDTNITHPDHIDFYLVSHASIQGTARPTKYRCICNDSKFTEDQLEQMTYCLCHMYARCTRSVSYPTPTYYAHLAAFRGKALLQGRGERFSLDNLEQEQKKFKMKMGASPMYFV